MDSEITYLPAASAAANKTRGGGGGGGGGGGLSSWGSTGDLSGAFKGANQFANHVNRRRKGSQATLRILPQFFLWPVWSGCGNSAAATYYCLKGTERSALSTALHSKREAHFLAYLVPIFLESGFWQTACHPPQTPALPDRSLRRTPPPPPPP